MQQQPLVTWRAMVQIAGVPRVTPEELAKVADIIPGSISHTRGRHGGSLFLDWRFECTDVRTAMEEASVAWRQAVRLIDSATDPQCTDFRVLRVFPSKKEKT